MKQTREEETEEKQNERGGIKTKYRTTAKISRMYVPLANNQWKSMKTENEWLDIYLY